MPETSQHKSPPLPTATARKPKPVWLLPGGCSSREKPNPEIQPLSCKHLDTGQASITCQFHLNRVWANNTVGPKKMKKATKRRDVYDVHDPAHYDFGIRDSACVLLSLFLADKAAHQLIAKYEFEGIAAEYTGYREERVIRLLIAIATAYRLKSWKMTKEESAEEKKTWVGVLFPEGDGEGERLSMHEACNKIIHAEEFAFETRKLRKSEFAYAKQDILISGKKGKAEWMAAIWIIEFSDAALTMPSTLNF